MAPRLLVACFLFLCASASAQLIDRTKAPNTSNTGIAKSLADEIGVGRGDANTDRSSVFIIQRDPFRAIRRGRQLFQRKFTRVEGQGPVAADGAGDVNTNLAIGAGLADSCAACHGRPRGAAGFGGDVNTRPDSRDAPHLFGLGLKEMLADEITSQLRRIRTTAVGDAMTTHQPVTRALIAKGISYGSITANPDGTVNTTEVKGVDKDLRVRPFFAHGGTISIREFAVGAFNDEMGIQSADPDLLAASAGGRVVTPSGMVLDGSLDKINAPPSAAPGNDPDGDGVVNEMPESAVDFMEFYLLNYFKAGHGRVGPGANAGRKLMQNIGCTGCHMQNLTIDHDRRVADVETVYDPAHGNFNELFSTASARFVATDDGTGFPSFKRPSGENFVVKDIFTDLKRHDVGAGFYERNFDGTTRKEFMTTPLWGVGSTPTYGHDGRSMTLRDVILRHGGEAQKARDAFAKLDADGQDALTGFLQTLIIFPPDDTASNLDPGDRSAVGFPQNGHGSIKLTVLFNDPSDPE